MAYRLEGSLLEFCTCNAICPAGLVKTLMVALAT